MKTTKALATCLLGGALGTALVLTRASLPGLFVNAGPWSGTAALVMSVVTFGAGVSLIVVISRALARILSS